jgi:hypothetical protein
MAEIDPLLKLIGQVGIFIAAVVALWYAVFVPRKNKHNDPKSSLLVPGWIVDDLKAESERRVRFYEQALKDEQERANVRISEWRGFRDEAVARATDAEDDREQLLEAVQVLSRDVQRLLDIDAAARATPKTASGEASE